MDVELEKPLETKLSVSRLRKFENVCEVCYIVNR